MVSKTRSQNKMTGDEGSFDARAEIAAIREEVAELKGMRAEMSEIKLLLKRLCPPEPDGTAPSPGTSKVNVLDLPPTNLGDDVRRGMGGRTASDPVNTRVGNDITGVQFYIEPNTVNPSLAPVHTAAIRTSSQGGLNLPAPQIGKGNHYGIDWNHPFLSNHQYNPITGQFLNVDHVPQTAGVRLLDSQGRPQLGNSSNVTHYAEAVIRGPKLEIPLFSGEDSVEWLKQCEQFFALSGTPVEQ